MFYLLKSTNDREKTGDVIIDLTQIESFTMNKIVMENETFYRLRIGMKSKDDWQINFNTEEELRQELKNIGIQESIASDLLISERNQKKDKEECIKQMMESMIK